MDLSYYPFTHHFLTKVYDNKTYIPEKFYKNVIK
jgi:hypothetical protein